MVVEVEPIESNGQFYVEVIIDGVAMSAPRGPYVDADTAGSVARQLLQLSRTLTGGGDRG